MKFCYSCGRSTGGRPLYCGSCGRSYDIKLCPSRHGNPRWADTCSRCGSRNLSQPQRRIPVLWRIVAVAVLAVSAVPLLVASFVLAITTWKYLAEREVPFAGLVALGVFLAALWAAWGTLPHAARRAIRRLLKRRDLNRD